MTTMITDKQVTDALVEVRQLLTPPGAWIQGSYACGAAGSGVDPASPAATCWCLQGALLRVAHTAPRDPSGPILTAVNALQRTLTIVVSEHVTGEIGASEIHAWNDDARRTHAEVLDTLDDLISKRRAAEART